MLMALSLPTGGMLSTKASVDVIHSLNVSWDGVNGSNYFATYSRDNPAPASNLPTPARADADAYYRAVDELARDPVIHAALENVNRNESFAPRLQPRIESSVSYYFDPESHADRPLPAGTMRFVTCFGVISRDSALPFSRLDPIEPPYDPIARRFDLVRVRANLLARLNAQIADLSETALSPPPAAAIAAQKLQWQKTLHPRTIYLPAPPPATATELEAIRASAGAPYVPTGEDVWGEAEVGEP